MTTTTAATTGGGASATGAASRTAVPRSPRASLREGLLDILPEGYGFLRTSGYLPGDKDVYVSAGQIRKFGLRKGMVGPDPPAPFEEIPGSHPHRIRQRHTRRVRQEPSPVRGPHAAAPDERLRLEVEGEGSTLTRIVDLIALIGKGQRG